MKIFIIGGTGLIGSEAARELIARGHEVSALALPPVPDGAALPPGMHLSFGNYLEMSDVQLRSCLAGQTGLVFAAGIDERVEGPAPIEELYRKYNIAPLQHILTIARECGIRHVVVCGSYFSYFSKILPELKMTEKHPYIRSRIAQEEMALSFAKAGQMDVTVLELPYIFGTQPGRKPVWLFLVKRILGMKNMTLYPRGGSAMVTVRQVGQAIAGAVVENQGGQACPVGYYNLTWREMLAIMHRHMGTPDKRIVTIPDWVFRLVCRSLASDQRKRQIDGGLKAVEFAEIMTKNLFIDPEIGAAPLGIQPDDLDAAIGDSVRLCLEILKGRPAIDMRGE
jgi:dihydroflavonol-4-reductase